MRDGRAPVGETTVVWEYGVFGEPTTDSAPALVLTPEAAGVLDLDVRTGGPDRLTGDTAALDSETAASLGAATGDRVRLLPAIAAVVAGIAFATVEVPPAGPCGPRPSARD